MFRKLIIILLPLIFLLSCSGILWDGKSSNELNISISNPYYQPTSSSHNGRAIALQGKYLYIELAFIEDQVGYDNDTEKLLTGNGTWLNTDWGGHAILTFALDSTIDTLDAIFVDVPRDSDVKARVLLEKDQETFTIGMEGLYGNDGDPICQTYNSSGITYEEQQWISLTEEELKSNSISLPIRPLSPETLFWGTSMFINDDYTSAAQTIPSLLETRFFLIQPDIASLQVRDVAYFSHVYGTVLTGDAPPTSLSLLYDNNGNPFEASSPTYTFNSPNYDYKLFQIVHANLADHNSPEYLFGTSLLLAPTLSWNLSFGLLYDNAAVADNFNSSLNVSWSVPTGIDGTDLAFKVIHIINTEVVPDITYIDTVDKVYSFGNDLDTPWDASGSLNHWEGVFPQATTGSWVIILARYNNGEPFIYAIVQAAEIPV